MRKDPLLWPRSVVPGSCLLVVGEQVRVAHLQAIREGDVGRPLHLEMCFAVLPVDLGFLLLVVAVVVALGALLVRALILVVF